MILLFRMIVMRLTSMYVGKNSPPLPPPHRTPPLTRRHLRDLMVHQSLWIQYTQTYRSLAAFWCAVR